MGTGYTSFRSGLPTVASRTHGVGVAARTALLQSSQESPIALGERLMTLQLPLAKNRFATFVSVYSPTLDSSDDVNDRCYDMLYSTLQRILLNDKIILLGDFIAKVGRNHDIWHGVIGHHGVGNINSSGLRLLSLCSELGLPSQTPSSNSVTCTRLLGCIPSPNTGTSSLSSLTGAMT